MDLDLEDQGRILSGTPSLPTKPRRLELVGGDSGLSSLDISFDASTSADGKIRVRIHPSSASSAGPSSPTLSYPSSSLAMWAGADSTSHFDSFSESFTSPTTDNDPFLGVGASNEFTHYSNGASAMFDQEGSSVDFASLQSNAGFAFGSEFDVSSAGKRRVRIALKSLPSAGGEGGEWEVQLC